MNTAVSLTKAFSDAASGFSNFGSYTDAAKGSVAVGNRLSKVALSSARENARISDKWTNEMIASLQKIFQVKETPFEYSSAVAEFTANTAEASLRHFAEYSNVAKNALTESIACCLDFGDSENGTAPAPKKKSSKPALGKTTKMN